VLQPDHLAARLHPALVVVSSGEKETAAEWLSPQLTAFFTSAPILASSAAVSSFNAKAVGHMWPSSRFALSLNEAERRVPRLELLRTLEEADDIAVLGIRGHPVPGFRREGWRIGFDDRMEALAVLQPVQSAY
jgi:hypothetical protein